MIVTRTYTIKLKPNSSQRKQLHQYFYEAKILYNYLLNCSNIFAVTSCKIKHPWKYDRDKNKVKVELNSLPSKLKQNVHRQILDSIKSLSISKKKGYTVGKLKFKSEIKTIELDNQCYSIEDLNHVKIVGFGRKKIRARGIHQFSNVIKFRNAKLMKKKMMNFSLRSVFQKKSSFMSIQETVLESTWELKQLLLYQQVKNLIARLKKLLA